MRYFPALILDDTNGLFYLYRISSDNTIDIEELDSWSDALRAFCYHCNQVSPDDMPDPDYIVDVGF